MFKIVTIPGSKYKSCSDCPHLERHLVQSGRNPKYSHHCQHPDTEQPRFSLIFGNIGESDRTPDWCPFVKNPEGYRSNSAANPYAPLQTKIKEGFSEIDDAEAKDRIEAATNHHYNSKFGVDLDWV